MLGVSSLRPLLREHRGRLRPASPGAAAQPARPRSGARDTHATSRTAFAARRAPAGRPPPSRGIATGRGGSFFGARQDLGAIGFRCAKRGEIVRELRDGARRSDSSSRVTSAWARVSSARAAAMPPAFRLNSGTLMPASNVPSQPIGRPVSSPCSRLYARRRAGTDPERCHVWRERSRPAFARAPHARHASPGSAPAVFE